MAGHPHRASVVVLTLLIVLLVLVTIAATGAAVLVFSDRFTSVASPWVSPMSAIKAGAINPSLALGSLAGTDDQAVIEQAAAAGSNETVLSTLLYSTALHDQSRTAGLLTAAGAMARSGRKDVAVQAALTAMDVAILSPVIPDYSRAALLAQAGAVLSSLGKNNDATHAYSVAAIIAEYSGHIDPSYRQLLLQGLADDLNRIGRKDQARELRAAAASDPPPADKAVSVLPALVTPLIRDDSSAWAELDAATVERVAIAGTLVAVLQGQSPQSSEQTRQALEKALLREDALREQVYSAGIARSDNLLQRVAYARARMDWLTLKWRVARQGFGMALAPTWENQQQDIEADLSQACQEYYLILRDAALSLPLQTDAVQGEIDAIQDQIKMGRLGLPPYAQEGELVRSLELMQQERMNLGVGQLLVMVRTDGGKSQLTVVSSR